jgi:hypothetical protein
VDLLGKADAVVARRPPTRIVPARYRPGHNKWDYAYSLGRLRPPVIASLWMPTAGDLCDVARWGYRQVAPGVYALRGARGVDAPGLAAAIRQLGPTPPDPSPRGCAGGA